MERSSRLPRSLAPTPFARRVREFQARPDFLDLTVSNPTRCGFLRTDSPWRESLASKEVLTYAADPMGSREAREAIAAHHGHGVQADDLVLTASTSEAYSWLFKLCAGPGDEVLVPCPSYPLFEHLAALEGLQALPVPAYFHERWTLDLEALEAACGLRTRAVVVVNPNNPTGQFLSQDEWSGLTRLCAARDLVLVVDEVFADFPLEPREDSFRTALLDDAPPCPVFVLSGLSKVALLPQVKLGWIVARGPAREWMEDLAFIADQYLSVSAPAQAAAAPALSGAPAFRREVLSRAQANLRCLDRRLEAFPHLSRLPMEGGWSVLLRRPSIQEDEACAMALLEESCTLVQPGHFFDLPGEGYLVLSLLTPPEIFAEGLRRILPRLPLD